MMSSPGCLVDIRVQAEPFHSGAETDRMTRGRRDIGAVVAFTGLCRDEDATLAALEIEHYPGMAEAEIGRFVDEAQHRWQLAAVTVVHRHGRMEPGDPIVLVLTASRHRRSAFEAANFLMDYLKTRAPFWKKEHRLDRRTATWVLANAADDDAAGRWGS